MSIEINDELKQRYVEIIRNIWPTMAFVQSLNSGAITAETVEVANNTLEEIARCSLPFKGVVQRFKDFYTPSAKDKWPEAIKKSPDSFGKWIEALRSSRRYKGCIDISARNHRSDVEYSLDWNAL